MWLLLILACGGKAPPVSGGEGPSEAPTETPEETPPANERVCTLSSCLPTGLQEIPFGTPLATFQQAYPDLKAEPALFPFRHVYTLPTEGPLHTQADLYFDASMDQQPLYEVIVTYPEGHDVRGTAMILLGAPNDGEDWAVPLEGEPVPLKAWVFEQKLVLTVPWYGTEYDPAEGEL